MAEADGSVRVAILLFDWNVYFVRTTFVELVLRNTRIGCVRIYVFLPKEKADDNDYQNLDFSVRPS